MSKSDEIVEDFIKNLQWNLRAAYNSSSCLGAKQREFLRDALYELVVDYEGRIEKLGNNMNIQELRKELTRHDYRYYILFQPTITDQQYDRMYKEWMDLGGVDTHSLEIEELYPQWVRDEFKNEKPIL